MFSEVRKMIERGEEKTEGTMMRMAIGYDLDENTTNSSAKVSQIILTDGSNIIVHSTKSSTQSTKYINILKITYFVPFSYTEDCE